MPKSKSELKRTTVYLAPEQINKLRDHFPKLGASEVIRRLIANFIDKLDAPADDAQLEELSAVLEDEIHAEA